MRSLRQPSELSSQAAWPRHITGKGTEDRFCAAPHNLSARRWGPADQAEGSVHRGDHRRQGPFADRDDHPETAPRQPGAEQDDGHPVNDRASPRSYCSGAPLGESTGEIPCPYAERISGRLEGVSHGSRHPCRRDFSPPGDVALTVPCHSLRPKHARPAVVPRSDPTIRGTEIGCPWALTPPHLRCRVVALAVIVSI